MTCPKDELRTVTNKPYQNFISIAVVSGNRPGAVTFISVFDVPKKVQ